MKLPLIPGLAAMAILVACAQSVPSVPASFTPLAASAAPAAGGFRLLKAAEVKLPTQYTRVLPAGSRWRLAGQLPQGMVYRPVDGVFSIEGRQVHEAYLVVSKTQLVGFYLVGEAAYSPLGTAVSLSMESSQ